MKPCPLDSNSNCFPPIASEGLSLLLDLKAGRGHLNKPDLT